MADAARCDNCSTHADRPGSGGWTQLPDYIASSPTGWVRLMAQQSMGAGFDARAEPEVRIETCSWRCAAKWMLRYADEHTVVDA